MDDLKEKPLEEPSLEDFFANEEDEWLIERQKKRRALIKKVTAIILSFSLIVMTIQIWPQIFNLSSLSFLKKSAELSQRAEIQRYKEAVVTIQDQHTKGTGFNISSKGLIITNEHVIDTMFPITVTFPNGKLFHATILVSDPALDVAVLQVDGEELPFLPLSQPEAWEIDDPIYVIGNPLFHQQIANEGHILAGSDRAGVLRISAPIYKGNSGSPVISKNGEVVGVVYATSTREKVGYAIPIEQLWEKLPESFVQ